MQDLRLTLIQANLHWEKPEENQLNLAMLMNRNEEPTDAYIFPEMFSTGFTLNASRVAEPHEGPSFKWMQQQALKREVALAGSLLVEENQNFYNRFYWINPDGSFHYYDKRHLFSMAGEHKVMSAGNQQVIINYKGWKICLQVCYDLRFPVWSKNTLIAGKHSYDALIYVANWPEIRRDAYLKLLYARALENQSYVVWVNRVGKDGNQVNHTGDSCGIDPYGKLLHMANKNEEAIVNLELSEAELNRFRNKFQVGLDWDEFEIKDFNK